MLATVLCIPAALEELSVSFAYMWCADCTEPNVHPGLLSKALRQHRRTLCVPDLEWGCAHIVVQWAHEECEDDADQPRDSGVYCYELDLTASEGPPRAYDLTDEHRSETIGSLRDPTAL